MNLRRSRIELSQDLFVQHTFLLQLGEFMCIFIVYAEYTNYVLISKVMVLESTNDCLKVSRFSKI